MNAKKCDRCGEFFQNTTTTVAEELSAAAKQLFESNENYRIRMLISSVAVNVDLCKNCSDSLKSWFKDGGNENA